MKVWVAELSNNESYERWTMFAGVYASIEKARKGVHENAKENGWEISHEYHPQIGNYKGEDPDVWCFTVSPNGYEYEVRITELDLDDLSDDPH